MAHGYSIQKETKAEVVYQKTHNNGEKTKVRIERIGQGSGKHYSVFVNDPNGNKRLGKFGSKGDARSEATRWMNNNPKGLQGPGGAMGTVNAMEEATNSIFTGGGRF